jgi:uncharacterized membrane protein
VREEDILRTDISVDDALKMIVSAGRISVNRVNRSISKNYSEASVRKLPPTPSEDDTA